MDQTKSIIKKILKHIGAKKINILARYSRNVFYSFLDSAGYLIFSPFLLLSPKEALSREKVKRILIIRLDRIGDLILSTPAIRAVRSTFPKAEIHMLIAEYTKNLIINNPNINTVLIYKKNKINKDYDLAIALHPGFRQNYLTFVSGAKFRVGYTGWGGGFFLTHKLKDDRAERVRHEVESALEVVGLVGCKTDDKGLEISITEEGERFAEDFFQKNNLLPDNLIVVIHPGARQEYIRWKKERFAEVADRLIKQDAKVILTGSKKEKQLLEETASLMEEKPLFATGLILTQLISLIKRSNLFIGNSTGPMHIAAALKVPVVAVLGPVHPLDSYKEWGPWGDGHVVVSKDLDCPECHPTDCRTFDCMKLITAEEVFEAAKKISRKK